MPDSNLFALELVTPERVLIDALAAEVILRDGEGDVTFLAGHAPLVGTVEPGVLRVVGPEGEVERVAVHGGFVQVGEDPADASPTSTGPTPARTTRVTLLIGVAEPADEIDVDRARAALEVAEARVAELTGAGGRGTGPVEEEYDPVLIEAGAALRRAEVRLAAVEPGSSGGGTATAA